MLSVICNLRQPGEPTDGRWFIEDGWLEFSELRFSSLEEFTRRTHDGLCSIERLEMVALWDGRPAGFMALALDDDMHVGPCLAVQWQFVLPPYRNLGVAPRFMREAKTVARKLRVPTIAFTHRLGPGTYKTSYRRLHGKED